MKDRLMGTLMLTLVVFAAISVLTPEAVAQRAEVARPTANSRQAQKVRAVTPSATGTPPIKSGLVGPTENITKVANAIQVQAKSLNTLVSISPGLALTNPVTVSVAYLSPHASLGNERRTQPYAPSVGNSFLYTDPEADGGPRKIHLDITLSQTRPGGGDYSFNVPADVVLDPLYDVSISPLAFKLVTGCSNVGANQIDLRWYAPDNSGNFQTVHFAIREGETSSIREFSWARLAVSATQNFHRETVWYHETGIHTGFGPASSGWSSANLVPGKTRRSPQGLVDSEGGTQDCRATLDYTVTYQLRGYLGAPTVRDHR